MLGSWYVLCRRDNLVPLTNFATPLAGLRYGRVIEIDADYAEIEIDDQLTGNKAKIRVFVDDEAQVADEVREIAALFPDRADRDEIAAADVRYTISWDLAYSDETYNARCVIAETFARAAHGIVYELAEDRIVWSSFE